LQKFVARLPSFSTPRIKKSGSFIPAFNFFKKLCGILP